MSKAFEFCIPTAGTRVPHTPDWLHEIKYDGYRLRVGATAIDGRMTSACLMWNRGLLVMLAADVARKKIDWRRMLGIEAARWLDYAV